MVNDSYDGFMESASRAFIVRAKSWIQIPRRNVGLTKQVMSEVEKLLMKEISHVARL